MHALLPAPVRSYATYSDNEVPPQGPQEQKHSDSTPERTIPSYPTRVQARFAPRSLNDFGNGGAYPEIHLAQFPLYMGKKKDIVRDNSHVFSNAVSGFDTKVPEKRSAQRQDTLALQICGEDGRVNYDAIVKQHHRDKKAVYTQYSDLIEKPIHSAQNQAPLPSHDEELETTNRTREALQAITQGKIAAALPLNVSRQKTAQETSSYIRYTPNDQGKIGDGQKQRIVRVVEVPKDPMEPPKFQHKKTVRGPPSPPVPVLHSPPRKLTVQDQQAWKIPPCISNWKNTKGFTIALDKRLAADGRGLQQVTVNDNFASFSEALAIAERKAREEVNMRAQVRKKVAMKQKEEKEKELRELAMKARMERAGIRPDDEEDGNRRSSRRSSSAEQESGSEVDDVNGRLERDKIRRERKKDREREMRMQKLGKKGKLTRDTDRDVSEKIALGQLQGAGKLSGEGMFDSRLFNQSQGLSSGFGQEDDYTVYSKPLIDRGEASVYRPKVEEGFADADKEYEELKSGRRKQFKADKQFRGSEGINKRDGPVQFSYDEPDQSEEEERKKPSTARSKSRSRTRKRSCSSSARGRQTRRRHQRSPSQSPPRRSSKRYRENSPYRSRKNPTRDENDKDSDPFGLDQFLSEARRGKSRR